MASQKHSATRFAKSIPPRFSEASDAPPHACAPELERPEPMWQVLSRVPAGRF